MTVILWWSFQDFHPSGKPKRLNDLSASAIPDYSRLEPTSFFKSDSVYSVSAFHLLIFLYFSPSILLVFIANPKVSLKFYVKVKKNIRLLTLFKTSGFFATSIEGFHENLY